MNKQTEGLEVRHTRLGKFTVVGFSENISPQGMGHLWDELYSRMDEIINSDNRKVGYGIIKNQKYFAGIEVSSTNEIPEGMEYIIVPENEYAVFTHKGQIQFLKQTWDLIAQHYSIDCTIIEASFERYDERFDPISDDSLLEIYVPLNK